MHAPPVARLALAFAAGASWGIAGAPLWTAPLLLALGAMAPIWTSSDPRSRLWLLVAALGAAAARGGDEGSRCFLPSGGVRAEVAGRFLASPRSGSAPFLLRSGCPPVTVVTSDTTLLAGVRLTVVGTWVEGRRRPWLRASAVRPRTPLAASRDSSSRSMWSPSELPWSVVRWRDELVRRAYRLYGPRGPLVAALTLARREGVDRSLSETFARTGIAHLLAISGFHVGVIAGAMLALLRLAGVPRRRAGLVAAGLAWAYVGLIGFPDAACRAALILTLVAMGRARGRPAARWGALATAFLVLVVLEPARLASPGFQLSFAGAAGLVAWGRRLSVTVRRLGGRRCPRALASGVGAGVGATLATLPIVAWHFERVSLVGIPVTLAATPLVSVALPGAILSLLIDPALPGGARFVAGGVDTLLALLEWMTAWVGGISWASVWTSRPSVLAGCAGCAVATGMARHPRVTARGRRALIGAYVAVGLVGWPMVARWGGWGTIEIVVIDVGQGDAIAVRSPRGHWLLVDAGPGVAPGTDAGGHPVVRALRARGVVRLEALVLTHPDLDHIGGAAAVLSSVDVRAVFDPAIAAGKMSYLEVLEAADREGVPWIAARAGRTIELDGMTVEVLHPVDTLMSGVETNEASVVLRVTYGDFDALLTGDAYKATERRISGALSGLEVLKVGHHGSDTSTDSLLLARARPRVALVSVGRFNRYGHPAPEVLARLDRAEVSVHRTDLAGTISVTGRRDGSFSVRTERIGPSGTAPSAQGR